MRPFNHAKLQNVKASLGCMYLVTFLVNNNISFFRFRDPALRSLFDEESGVFKDHSRCLPSIHISLMRIWVTWLEKFPQDFRENPTLQVRDIERVKGTSLYWTLLVTEET